jgi:hypothetical protein
MVIKNVLPGHPISQSAIANYDLYRTKHFDKTEMKVNTLRRNFKHIGPFRLPNSDGHIIDAQMPPVGAHGDVSEKATP